MPNEKRADIARKVIECLGEKDFIFGGYPRSYIEGTEFKDIDLVCHTEIKCCYPHDKEEAFTRVVASLRKKFEPLGAKVTVGSSKLSYNTKKNIWKRIVTVHYNGETVNIDLLSTKDNDPFSVIDFDINCLKVTANGTITAAENYNKAEICENIKNRECRKISEPPQWRIDKFTDAGYTVITGEQEKKKVSLSNSKNKTITQENKTMATTTAARPDFFTMTKSDSTEAAYRVGAHQLSKVVKGGITAALRSKGFFNKNKKAKELAVEELLNSELGDILIKAGLGYGLTYAPHISGDPRVARLAHELRVGSMETAGNAIFGTLTEHLMPGVMDVIQKLPELTESTNPTKTRIAADTSRDQAAEEEHEAEEQAHTEVVAKARA